MAKNSLWLLVILLGLGQLQRFEISLRSIQLVVYAHDLFIAGWLAWRVREGWPVAIRKCQQVLSAYPQVAVLLGWIGAGMVLNTLLFQSWIAWAYAIRLVAYCLFGLNLTQVFTRPIDKVDLRERYIVSGLAIALAGLAQYIWLPDTRFLQTFGWDDHYYRLISTLFDPSFTGICLVVTWIYVQSIGWIQRHPVLLASLSALLTVALGLTFSRASYLAFALVVLGALYLYKHAKSTYPRGRMVVLMSAVLLLATVWYAPKPAGEGVRLTRTSTIQSRLENSAAVWQGASLKTLLIGDGLFTPLAAENGNDTNLGTSRSQSHARLPDNSVMLLLKALGIPGLIMSALVALRAGQALWRADRWMALAAMAVLLHSQFNNTLFEPFTLLFVLGGLSSLARRGDDYPFTA